MDEKAITTLIQGGEITAEQAEFAHRAQRQEASDRVEARAAGEREAQRQAYEAAQLGQLEKAIAEGDLSAIMDVARDTNNPHFERARQEIASALPSWTWD